MTQYVYRNRNTLEEVTADEPRWRLERLPNWERVSGPDPAEAAAEEVEVPADLSGLGEAQMAEDESDTMPDPVSDLDADGNVPAEPASTGDEAAAVLGAVLTEDVAEAVAEPEPEAVSETAEPKPVAKKATRAKTAKAGGE